MESGLASIFRQNSHCHSNPLGPSQHFFAYSFATWENLWEHPVFHGKTGGKTRCSDKEMAFTARTAALGEQDQVLQERLEELARQNGEVGRGVVVNVGQI